MTELSIIVPVYNVEKYIKPCLESIFRQGLDDSVFEVIIINDGTNDNSLEVIATIISQHKNITVINQENQGLSVARNNGIALAHGEYILMPDSDDLLIENSLPQLLKVALKTKVDLVVADFISMSDEEIELTNTHLSQQTSFDYQEKTGKNLFLQDLNPYHCYVWRTLFRREFLLNNHIKFVPRIYFEDIPFTHECYLKAKRCIKTSWLLYIYRRGHESATFSYNQKKVKDYCTAIAKTWDLTHLDRLSTTEQNKLRDNIYNSFSLMVWLTSNQIKKASNRTEIMDFLKKEAPDLLFQNGTKQIIVSYMYRHLPHSYIHIRYLYAIIFENHILPFIKHRLRRPFYKK